MHASILVHIFSLACFVLIFCLICLLGRSELGRVCIYTIAQRFKSLDLSRI